MINGISQIKQLLLLIKPQNKIKANDKMNKLDVEQRLMNYCETKQEKIKALEISLTPKFKPNINKNSTRILKNSEQKSRNIQQKLRQYKSMSIVSNLTHRFNSKSNTEDFSDIVQDLLSTFWRRLKDFLYWRLFWYSSRI